jgi:hypothetical protein
MSALKEFELRSRGKSPNIMAAKMHKWLKRTCFLVIFVPFCGCRNSQTAPGLQMSDLRAGSETGAPGK